MTITLSSLSARPGDEVAVTFEIRSGENLQKETFLISAALVADLKLCRGICSRDCYDAVSHGAEVYRAVKRGLYLLGYGTCSERALCRKLMVKGIDREIAAEAVKELNRLGYLDPGADALREAERCVAKRWGERRIRATLFAKGYSEQSVRYALNSLEDGGVDYAALCAERIREQVGVVPSDPVARRKLMVSLERYGFSFSEIREALRAVANER